MNIFKKLTIPIFFVFIFLTLKLNCHAGELLQRTTFEDRNMLPWKFDAVHSNDSAFQLVNKRLELLMIESSSRFSLSHENISIIEGHTYSLELDVNTSYACEVSVGISSEDLPYTPIWNNDNQTIKLDGQTNLKIKKTFVAKSSCPESRLSFAFDGKLSSNRYNYINFSRISLTDEQYIAPTPTPIYNIAVNQIGYYPESVKRATINTSSITPMDWHIEDSTGKIVASGKTELYYQEPSHTDDPFYAYDFASGNRVQHIDFSSFTTPGNGYRLICNDELSMRFNIGNNLYSQLKIDSLKYLYHSRSGISINTPYISDSKWSHSAEHTNDTAIKYGEDIANRYSKVSNSIPFSIDATGGWYNGLGYGKSIDKGAISLWTLQNQYEYGNINNISDIFDDNLLNIPESANGIPDILDETRWEMEWMLKMQIPKGYDIEGMVFEKIDGTAPQPYPTSPDGYKETRMFYPPTTIATLSFSACAAQASRIWKNIDPDFSQKCLVASEAAWKAAVKNPDMLPNGSNFNDTRINIATDEFYWAACELYLTTRSKEYLEFINNSEHFCSMPTYLPTSDIWSNTSFSASFDKNETAGLGSLSLSLLACEEFPKVIENIKKAADEFIKIEKENGYEVPFYSEMYGKMYYPILSNKYVADASIVMSYAYSLSNDKKYLDGATKAMDYLMGRNAINKCYVTGYGTNPVKNPYDYFFNERLIDDYPVVPPGFMVAGPTFEDNEIEAWAPRNPYERFSQKCYDDEDYGFRYLTNSFDISLNSSLTWVTSFIENANSHEVPGDINNDKKVNMLDVVILAKSFGSISGDGLFNARCDLNNDGVINMKDVIIIANNFCK